MKETIDKIVNQIGQIVLGKDREIRMVLTCLLAKGHLLIEDIPGVGKTTLAQALAKSLGLSYSRVQFTSDMLPADILGTTIFDREKNEFRFHPGPVFDHMVLGDELNRATPRTQSALLEAMEERQVSVDGVTHALPNPFFVIATQNQRYHVGTFPLPESQLDRFLMRLHLGYPDYRAERKILVGESRIDMLKRLTPIISVETLLGMQRKVTGIHVSDAILDYIQDIIAVSRGGSHHYLGLSPRAGISLVRAAQAWAMGQGRDMVLPEDVQDVSGSVLEHRLDPEGGKVKHKGAPAAEQLIKTIAVNR
jgi:MoxR-like ATPase